MRIVIGYPVKPRHLQQIAAAAPGAEIVDAGQQRIPEEILQADIFCGHAKERPVPWDEVVGGSRLRWIQSSAAGLDHCLTPSVIGSDIAVTSASGLFADQVAEQTLALLLGLLRNLPVFFRASLRREFIRRPTRDLHHATIGIVGFGGNGRRLAEILAPFKTRILATDAFPVHKPPHVAELWHADRLDQLLTESDVVVLCVPLNRWTKGMIAASQLARMKSGAILVNVARGPVVVGGPGRGLGVRASGRCRPGCDRNRAPTAGQSAVGTAQRDHHPPRRRPGRSPRKRRDGLLLREPPPLSGWRNAAEPRRQGPWVSAPRSVLGHKPLPSRMTSRAWQRHSQICVYVCAARRQGHEVHGARMGRSSRRLASSSFTNVSWAGSQRSFRRSLMAICWRWQMASEWTAMSMGAAG